jgi:IS30 family transposase
LERKYSLRSIALALNRSVSSISDEVKLNSVQGKYQSKKADCKARVRRKQSKYQGKKIVSNPKLRSMVEGMLYDDNSPTNIAGRIVNHEKYLPSISKDSIYRYIESVYGRRIECYRQTKRTRRRKRRVKTKKLEERTFIDERPKTIDLRQEIGDAEADFIVSGRNGQGIILVVADRKTRKVFLEKIVEVSIENVHYSFVKIKERFPEIKTITTDNDLLFKKHLELEKILNVKIYFCHPYHSWEKGTVENINKYIRRDIPKGSNISRYSKIFIQAIEEKLNRRPMKCLNYLTPTEAMLLEREKIEKQKKRLSVLKRECSD